MVGAVNIIGVLLIVFLSLILNLSNLIAECTPEEAFSIVGDHIVFASGSPFHDVDLGMPDKYFLLVFSRLGPYILNRKMHEYNTR